MAWCQVTPETRGGVGPSAGSRSDRTVHGRPRRAPAPRRGRRTSTPESPGRIGPVTRRDPGASTCGL
eukprot:231371-Hanusia_phi.AAC.1